MKFIQLFTLLFIPLTRQDEETLSDDERNLRCCAERAACCKIYPTDFEVKALLVKCHKSDKNPEKKKMPMTVVRTVRSTNQEEDCDRKRIEPKLGITNCKRKLKLTVKIKNTGLTNCKSQYVLIDHVFDSVTQRQQRLFNPYVLKIIQQPVFVVYGLSYDGIINAQAREMVANKDQPGYMGCNADNPINPACDSISYKSETIPYSNGFCCSCKNKESRHMNMSEFPFGHKFPQISRNSWQDSADFNKNELDTNVLDQGISMRGPLSNGKSPNSPVKDHYDFLKNFGTYEKNGKNKTPVSRLHTRGGQDCNDKYTPANIPNPEAYHSSTHCLQFSDVWYYVYRLEKPKIQHRLSLQLFEKYQTMEGGCKWRDLTKKIPVIVGTDKDDFINDELTLSINYTKRETTENLFTLNHQLHKLLIPDVASVEDKSSHPEVMGGPPEYLVVKGNQIQPNGKTCNVAGVGYEAFAKQPNRCSMPKGSCLKNQPIHMWEKDRQMESFGKKGNYFLKFYGLLPDEPVTPSGENKSLSIYFTNAYTSQLDLELKADDNPLLRANSLSTITEVYIESTNSHKTSIIAKVFNSGLIASLFYVGLTDCPLSLPASFSHIYSKPALIPPQQQHIYNLEIQCPLPLSGFVCSLQVLNMKQELIALRKIRLQESDRCVCMWHCSCACYSVDFGLKCQPLPLEAYHIAGFQGGEPLPLQVVEYTLWDDIIGMILYVFLTVCLTLLIMGLIKGLIGLCVVPIGLWGLDVVLDLPKKITKYYESDISHRPVIYDSNGWPIHPETMDKVRNVPVPAEFCINLIFFIVYPFCIIWYLLKKGCSDKIESKDIDVCYCKQGKSVQRKNRGLQNSLVKKSKIICESQIK